MIQPGTYTVQGKTRHITIKFEKADWATGLPEGTLSVGYLDGCDNERSFTRFAFALPTGELRLWTKYRSDAFHNQAWAANHLMNLDQEKLANAGYAYAMVSGKCYICGKKLTVPASLHRGMGPTCSKKTGGE